MTPDLGPTIYDLGLVTYISHFHCVGLIVQSNIGPIYFVQFFQCKYETQYYQHKRSIYHKSRVSLDFYALCYDLYTS